MRVSVFVGISIDGFLARPDGSLDFLKPFEREDLGFANVVYYVLVVTRMLRAVVLTLVLVQLGMVSMGAAACFESCPDDDDAGQCAPSCDCSTCGHPNLRSSMPSPVGLVAIPPCVDLAHPAPVVPLLPPVVAEILHVPKLLLV
jgi:hypothetical protein